MGSMVTISAITASAHAFLAPTATMGAGGADAITGGSAHTTDRKVFAQKTVILTPSFLRSSNGVPTHC